MVIETKYNIGDTVWYSYAESTPTCGTIDSITTLVEKDNNVQCMYVVTASNDSYCLPEDRLYTSLDAFIDHLNRKHLALINGIRKEAEKVQSEGEK